MGRKLAGVVFAVSTLHASVVSALGLGEIELKSGLNQPLQAEIVLSNVGDLNAQQLSVALANRTDFARAGVERVYFLNDLQFNVEVDEKGNGLVRISSKKLVREPYLDFVLEARWPTGRLLREYTVLVDMPMFSDNAVAAPAPASSRQAVATKPAPTKGRIPAPAPSASALPTPAAAGGEVVTRKSDTLWGLASRARPSGASMQQTMMAIYRSNTEAFARQNINGLRSGQVLRMPSAQQINELSKQQAIQAVAEQNAAWKSGKAAPLEAANTSAEQQNAPASATDQSYMTLSNSATQAETSGGSSAGVDDSAAAESVRSELNVAQEKLDRASRENEELDSRLDEVEGQVDTLEKLVELKDSQLAALQARLEQESTAPADQNFATDSTEPEQAAATEAEPGILDRLMSPLYLGGIGLLVLLGAAGLMFKRRSEMEEEGDDDWQDNYGTVESDAETLVAAEVQPEPDYEEFENTAEADEVEPAAENTVIEALNDTPADPLAEAEAYCSYDRHDDAVDILQKAIAQNPERTELHLKLLSIYAELDNEADFQAAYTAMEAVAGDDSLQLARELASGKGWLEISADDTSVDAVVDLGDTDIDTTESGSNELDNTDLDFDLDFDLSDVESLDDTEQHAKLDLAVDNLDLEDNGGLEFDLNLDEVIDEEGANDTAASIDNLDIDSSQDNDGLDVTAIADELDDDGDLSDMVDGDEIATKLDLARAYVDMGDVDGARDILEEVLQDGSENQVEEANSLLSKLTG